VKIASYVVKGEASYGAIVGDGVFDLKARLGHPTLRAAIAHAALTGLDVLGAKPTWELSEIVLTVPLPDSEKIICIGRNYKGHVAEGNNALPRTPSTFFRLHRSFVDPGQSLIRPRLSDQFDFEGELALVIGKPGRHIDRRDAYAHVAGYTCLQEGSIRDYQFDHGLTVGKNFSGTGSIGPWFVTADEIADPAALTLTTRLNGVEVQRTQTDDLIFDIPHIIAYISGFTELMPGDVISTGTPEGVGFARKPPLWLKPGDTVEVEISGIGVLRNSVIAEK
jgi:2-keto-4-pentenoate hydratase/2-oxohepta-3-ene-1,7-dioic acid hydratase in catechol pathway